MWIQRWDQKRVRDSVIVKHDGGHPTHVSRSFAGSTAPEGAERAARCGGSSHGASFLARTSGTMAPTSIAAAHIGGLVRLRSQEQGDDRDSKEPLRRTLAHEHGAAAFSFAGTLCTVQAPETCQGPTSRAVRRFRSRHHRHRKRTGSAKTRLGQRLTQFQTGRPCEHCTLVGCSRSAGEAALSSVSCCGTSASCMQSSSAARTCGAVCVFRTATKSRDPVKDQDASEQIRRHV